MADHRGPWSPRGWLTLHGPLSCGHGRSRISAGSLEGQRASKGVFITTSTFSAEARQYVDRISRRIVLIDGPTLAKYMYDHGIGVRPRKTLDVKGVDEAYFEGES